MYNRRKYCVLGLCILLMSSVACSDAADSPGNNESSVLDSDMPVPNDMFDMDHEGGLADTPVDMNEPDETPTFDMDMSSGATPDAAERTHARTFETGTGAMSAQGFAGSYHCTDNPDELSLYSSKRANGRKLGAYTLVFVEEGGRRDGLVDIRGYEFRPKEES